MKTKALILGALILGIVAGYGIRTYETSRPNNAVTIKPAEESADIVAAKYEIARLEQIGLTPAHPAVMRAEERLRMLERKANSPTQEDVDILRRKATAAKDLQAKKLAEQLRLRAQEGKAKSQ